MVAAVMVTVYRTGSLVDLGLTDPLPDGLGGGDPEQIRDPGHRGRVRLVIEPDLAIHPDRPSLQPSRIPLRRVS